MPENKEIKRFDDKEVILLKEGFQGIKNAIDGFEKTNNQLEKLVSQFKI